MADFVTNRAEMSALVKKFQSYGNDSMAYSRDHFEKNKREECCELQGGRLNFYESVKPDNNTTTIVVEVEKRRGTNILILRCGPGGRTVIFLEFDSKKLTDEWQEALCRYTGQTHVPHPALRRVRSELPAVVSRRRRLKKTRSTFPDVVDGQVDSVSSESESDSDSEQVEVSSQSESDSDSEQVEVSSQSESESPQDVPLEINQEAPPDSSHDSLSNADLSPEFADLAKNSVEKTFNLSDLQHLVTEAIPRCQLHIGGKIVFRNGRGLPMNAQELIEHIQTIVLTIVRGAVCTEREEEHELTINIKGSQILEPMNSDEVPNRPDGVLDPPLSDTASGSESPSGESLNGDSGSEYSPFSSLKSTCSDTDIDCPKDLLSQHQFKFYKDEIVVTQSVPDSKLHPGDTIALITGEGTTGEGTAGEGTTPKNTEELREYILKTEAPTIMLAVVRGVEITMKDGEQDLNINIRGPKTQRPDAVEAVLKTCNPNLAIAEINGAPIPVGTQEDQVAQILREALEGDSPEGHLYLIPRSLMTADDEESDTVQETRPINVEGNSSVSGNTTTTGNEETEC